MVQYPPDVVLDISPQPPEGVQLEVVDVDELPPDEVVVVVVVHPDDVDEVVVVEEVELVPELELELELELDVDEDPVDPDDRQLLVEAFCIVQSTFEPKPLALGISSQISDALSTPILT